jgi:putative methionine-R-sulfoxide reductase with GAF domain
MHADVDPPKTESQILDAIAATRWLLEAKELDAESVINLISHQAQFLTDAPGAVVELLEGKELVYRAASGTAAKSLGIRVDTSKSLSGLCFRTGETMRCDDTETDDRVDKPACRRVGIRSMVLVPFVHEGRSIGVLAIISPTAAAFGDREVWILQRLSSAFAGYISRGLPALPARDK